MEALIGFGIVYWASIKVAKEYERAQKAVTLDNKNLASIPNFNFDDFQRDDFQKEYNVLNEPSPEDIQRLGGMKSLGDPTYYKHLESEEDDILNQTATMGTRHTVPAFDSLV